ncbi:protein translocase subunit SecD [Paenibacillus turpanensis]|uniref:protein translocase subunit SecD n=1 Tax=Paenibacillus turpanensis TaxID=2689078 RepID=UPI00140DDA73|nr:protein translocase subunit SecD [Paenibacillus turpanensis]
MDKKRLIAFILLVIVSLGLVGVTTPGLVGNVKLGLDLKGGFEILYQAEPLEADQQVTKDALHQTARSLERRANAQGVGEPEVFPEGEDRIRLRLAGVENQDEVRALLKKPADLTFRGPDGTKEMVGADFVEGGAKVEYDPQTNQPYISLQIKNADKFRQVTEKLLGQPLAIYLDEEEISAPIIQAVIPNGQATITGNYTYDEAKKLADIINLGALPLKLTEKYTQSVGASLGQQSLEQTVRASIIGSLLILAFMLFYYRLPGMIAVITLITYTWLLLLVFDLINAVLTLPGIAAFVLGIGMAVDANIITYERIKDEIRSGKSVNSALRAGSRNSFRTILDANVTTILACIVLYYIGTGSVQGFALILIMSILVSMVTNVFFSRVLLNLLVRGAGVKKPGYFGVKEGEIRAL